MTTNHEHPTPVACTLTSADLAAQSQRWERLAARALTKRTETADGLRMFFRPEPGAEEELRALVAVENECCRWADWRVEADDRRIVLAVVADGDGITALHAMFAGIRGNGADHFFPAVFMRRVAQQRMGIVADEVPGGHCVALSNPRELSDLLVSYLG